MLTKLLPKITVPAALLIAGFIGGLTFQAKVLDSACPTIECPKVEVPRCPDCNCPPTLGNEFDKIKTKGKSNLTIHLHQNYTSGNDSTAIRQIVERAVMDALDRYKVKRKN